MPHRGTLSIQKAKDLIGYEPKWPVEKGYLEYINWYKNLFEQFVQKCLLARRQIVQHSIHIVPY